MADFSPSNTAAGMDPESGRLPSARSVGAVALAAVWVVATACGFVALTVYSTTPGASAPVAQRWPAQSRLAEPSDSRATLVLFAHPRCSCTRATLAEFERLLARTIDRVEAHVVFVRPPGAARGWEETDLWRRARRVPGVRVDVDDGGAEAERFGARTSGHVLLYDRDGVLRFSGGITASRGHEGQSPGRQAIEATLAGEPGQLTDAPVYGCALRESFSEGAEG